MGNTQAIGFFDSGLGGVHVLAKVAKALPTENYVYFGDSANAPYGTRNMEEVQQLTLKAVHNMVNQYGIKALVIACNTATGAAMEALEALYDFPIIGLSPVLNMAAAGSKNGKILVLATPLTLQSERYLSQYRVYSEKAVSLPCPGLMEFVEREELDSPALSKYLTELLAPYQHQQIDSLVLGCTHYPYLAKAIKKHVPTGTALYDGIPQVIAKLSHSLRTAGITNDSTRQGQVLLTSSGGDEKVQQMKRMFDLAQGQN